MDGFLPRLRTQVTACGVLLGLLFISCGCVGSGHPKPPPRTLAQPPTPAEEAALQRQAKRQAALEAKQQARAEKAAQKAAKKQEARNIAAQKVADKQAARRAAVAAREDAAKKAAQEKDAVAKKAAKEKAAKEAAAKKATEEKAAAREKAAKEKAAAKEKTAKEKKAAAAPKATKKTFTAKTSVAKKTPPKAKKVSPEPAPSTDETYILQPGDEIELQIYREPEISGTFRLNPAGEIRHPLAGAIPLAGKSLSKAEADLTDCFNQRYLVNPNIIVKLVSTTGGQIVLLGEVKKPGVYHFRVGETMTLLQAIAGAGGFTELASPDRVRIVRRKPDGTQETLPVRVSDLLRGKGKQQDIPLEPNDVITVPEVFF